MVFFGGTFVLLLFLTNNVYCNEGSYENYDEFYRPAINTIIDALNQDENRMYDYNYVRLISVNNKVLRLFLTLC